MKFAIFTGMGNTTWNDVLTLWKHADPDIPLLKQTKASIQNCGSSLPRAFPQTVGLPHA